jgi:hypothetical protein
VIDLYWQNYGTPFLTRLTFSSSDCQMEITCNHPLTVLGLALLRLYIKLLVLYYFIFVR